MEPVALFLVSIAGIFLIGALGEIVFERTNIPDVIWLILAGIVLGPVLGVVSREQLGQIAPFFAALTLIVVLFEGGSQLKLSELSKAAPRSSLLAVATFILAMLGVASLSMLAHAVGLLETWSWRHGLLLGSILGGSSSIIIMPAMARARVDASVGNLVGLESSLTDAFCVVGASALMNLIITGESGVGAPFASLLQSFGIGTGIGLVAGIFWILFLRFLHASEHAYPITLAALLILYVVINHAGGSAALGILACAVVLGNAPQLSKKIGLADTVELSHDVRGFHRQLAFFIKSFFFTFIGLMIAPPWGLLAFGVVLGIILFATRIPGVYLALARSSFDPPAKRLVAVAMPRGMAAGVLATLPFYAGVPGTQELPTIVFACVFTTILIFTAGFWTVMAQRRASLATPAAVPAGAAPVEASPATAPLTAVVQELEAAASVALAAASAAVPAAPQIGSADASSAQPTSTDTQPTATASEPDQTGA